MPPAIPPLDEQVFERPDILAGLPGGSINADSILWYFMNSPFYDPTSNNSALFNQLRNDPNGMAIMQDRRALEDRLRSSFPTGVSYVVASEPASPAEPWVIQRQFTAVKGGPPQIQGTYYTSGMKILMAPSLLDIMRSRMLSVSSHMAEVFETSKTLNHFAPATNHSYLPATYETGKAASGSRIGSRIGSPTLAAADPDTAVPPLASQSQSQSQSQAPSQTAATTAFSDALFMSSMHLTSSYYHEFMDENPLTGEPGAFVYNKTYDAVLQEREKQEQKQQKQQQQIADAAAAAASSTPAATTVVKPDPQSTTNSTAATPRTGPVGTPAALVLEAHSRKGSMSGAGGTKQGKEKRRKSKGLGSPVTPTTTNL